MLSDTSRISEWEHRPPHWYVDGSHHFITASTSAREPWLHAPAATHLLQQTMLKESHRLDVELLTWVILPDHYHALIRVREGEDLARWVRGVHSRSSRWRNGRDSLPGRRNWRQYWDRLLRSEGDFWSRVNYIHFNPVKHGYVQEPQEWPWSSLPIYLELADPDVSAHLARFPAPRHLPGELVD